MLYKSQFWILTILALLAAVFSIANMILYQSSRSMQLEVTSRQQYIQQSIQLQAIYTEMVRAIADLALRTQDGDLVNLLKSQGISFSGGPRVSPSTDATQGTK